MAWLLSALLATILFAVGMAFAAGYFGLRERPPSVAPVPAPAPVAQQAPAKTPEVEVTKPAPLRREATPPPDDELAPPSSPSDQLGPHDVPRTDDAADELADRLALDAGVVDAIGRLPRGKKPPYLLHLQKLQRAKTCEGKRAQIEALGEMGDARAVPALKRLYGRPRTGCGKTHREDCFGCLRKPLELALGKLGARLK